VVTRCLRAGDDRGKPRPTDRSTLRRVQLSWKPDQRGDERGGQACRSRFHR
jgi:hypothetical protein